MHENCVSREEHEKAIRQLQIRKEEFEKLQARCVELEKLVQILMSPQIPSSKKIIKEKKEEPREPKKHGAPIGHKGATRKTPEPNRVIDLRDQIPAKSPRYGANILSIDPFEKIIEDIEIVKKITKFIGYEVTYESGERFVTTHPDLPKRGRFGPNITAIWENMHYIGTIPFERLSRTSENCFDIGISPSGLQGVIYRNSKIFEPYFEEIKENVKNSHYAGSDETKYSDSWLWNISTNADVLVLMRNSRSSKVLREVFGNSYSGILNSDCFSAYELFEAREYQKCWAHVLDDAKDLAKYNNEGAELRKELSRMYKYIKKTKNNREEDTPKVRYWIWRQKQIIKLWLDKKYESKAVLNLVKRMNKYLDQWFTCLKYDFVEPTNNAREREIRKNVLSRKVSGCHRSEKGKRAREIMMSIILTEQKRNHNPFDYISNTIRNHNSNIMKTWS